MNDFTEIFSEITKYLKDHISSIVLIIIAIIAEISARIAKSRNKKIILTKYGDSVDQENNEFYLQYYQKNQIIDFFRVIGMIFFIVILFAINTNVGLGFFAIATGAFVMAFRDVILSIVAFFLVTPQYQIGTTVKVAWVQGQIIFIRMLSVGILGRDSHGENTGELFMVPNNKFITDVVEKEDLRTASILKDKLVIYYSAEIFNITFGEFMDELRPFLQWLFPILKANNVGNFPSYTGHKYKIDFYYDEDFTCIEIRFVGKIPQNKKNKEQIMRFVDKYMKR